MSHELPSNPCFAFPMAALAVGAVAALGAGLAVGACAVAGEPGQAASAAWAAGAAGLGSIAGLIPVALGSRQGAGAASLGFLLGMGLRAVLTLGLMLAGARLSGLAAREVGLWAAGWYLLLLGVEVVVIVSYLKRCDGQPGGAEAWR